jgi:hypothetical protein
MFASGEFGGVEASSCQGSSVMYHRRVVDRLFWEKSLSARPTLTQRHPWVEPFLPRGCRGYPSSTSLCVSRETLDHLVRAEASSLSFLKVSFGSWYVTIWWLERGGSFLEGAAVAGYLRLVGPHVSFFYVFADVPQFSFFSRLWLYRGVAILI